MRRTQGDRGTMAVALASRFWRLGRPKIFHEVATHLQEPKTGIKYPRLLSETGKAPVQYTVWEE